MIYRSFIKPVLDFIFSLSCIIILSPILIIVAVAIKIDSRGPIIFKQKRLGKNAKEYYIYKFRSMANNSEHTGSGVYSGKGDERVTRVGKIIRATSLDELPQLFNILKGDMALIGPRPPLTYHPWPIKDYTKKQKRMFEVRPGITGWAQVHGRKLVKWDKRIELNIWYVDHCSFWLDLKIFVMTLLKVAANEDNLSDGKTVEARK